MALILSLETATGICSICLHEGEEVLALREITRKNSHVESITLLIEEALRSSGKHLNELDAVALSAGPGSYTGLRVGTSTAKGLAYGLDIPLIAVPTLHYLARTLKPDKFNEEDLIVPVIDARRMEVYTCFFDGKMQMVKDLHSLVVDSNSFNSYLERFEKIYIVGNGAQKLDGLFKTDRIFLKQRECSAKDMVAIATTCYDQEKFEDLAYYSPLYYKSPNITTPKAIL